MLAVRLREHPVNSSLPLMLETVGMKELRGPDFPRTSLPFVIPRLYLSLVAPVEVFLCPGTKIDDSIKMRRERTRERLTL